jgi:hypothetical protein
MKKILSLLLIASLTLVACQKEIEDPNSTSNNNGNNGNNNSQDSYHPLTVGSWWKWKDSANGAVTTNTVLNVTKTINNVVFNGMLGSGSGQVDTGWAASPKPNYYYAAEGASPNGAPFDLLFHYLNDTASVGHTWEYNAGQGNGFTATIKTTIIAKNLSMTVEGKNYTSIIQTRLVMSYNIFGLVMEFGSYDYFTAKGVGIIKIISKLGVSGAVFENCTNLVDHKIM